MSTLSTRQPRMLRVEEIAEQLQVSTKAVRRWIGGGEMRVHRLGRRLRVSAEDLAAYLCARRH